MKLSLPNNPIIREFFSSQMSKRSNRNVTSIRLLLTDCAYARPEVNEILNKMNQSEFFKKNSVGNFLNECEVNFLVGSQGILTFYGSLTWLKFRFRISIWSFPVTQMRIWPEEA